MSDLIEHLRQIGCVNKPRCHEAADRIEELEASVVAKQLAIEAATAQIVLNSKRITELEAANAKMRKCLESIAEHHKDCLMLDHGALNNLMQLYHTERRDFAREGLK